MANMYLDRKVDSVQHVSFRIRKFGRASKCLSWKRFILSNLSRSLVYLSCQAFIATKSSAKTSWSSCKFLSKTLCRSGSLSTAFLITLNALCSSTNRLYRSSMVTALILFCISCSFIRPNNWAICCDSGGSANVFTFATFGSSRILAILFRHVSHMCTSTRIVMTIFVTKLNLQ